MTSRTRAPAYAIEDDEPDDELTTIIKNAGPAGWPEATAQQRTRRSSTAGGAAPAGAGRPGADAEVAQGRAGRGRRRRGDRHRVVPHLPVQPGLAPQRGDGTEPRSRPPARTPTWRPSPHQVNFACGKDTNQILWVFALMTSGDNPQFSDAKTGQAGPGADHPGSGRPGRVVAEPASPVQPEDPVDSLQVAARAINNIIGGATLTGTNGKPVVQPGLEGNPANCVKYTGSSAIVSHAGFPQPVRAAGDQLDRSGGAGGRHLPAVGRRASAAAA